MTLPTGDLALVTQSGHSLEFHLHAGPIAEWYLSVINTPHGDWDIDNKTATLDIAAAAAELGQLVNDPIDANNQQQLNHWHRQFETELKAGGYTQAWSRVNTLIHHIESLRGGSSYLGVSRLPDLRQPIPASLHGYWSHMQQTGDLCLGFNTIGKTLAACYHDRDYQQLVQGKVETQKDLHSQAVLTVARPKMPTHQHRAHEIQAWVMTIAHTQNLAQGLHQYHGSPLIARVVDLDAMRCWHAAIQQGHRVSHWETR